MIAHHTLGGCNLRPGDLIGSGTISSKVRCWFSMISRAWTRNFHWFISGMLLPEQDSIWFIDCARYNWCFAYRDLQGLVLSWRQQRMEQRPSHWMCVVPRLRESLLRTMILFHCVAGARVTTIALDLESVLANWLNDNRKLVFSHCKAGSVSQDCLKVTPSHKSMTSQ